MKLLFGAVALLIAAFAPLRAAAEDVALIIANTRDGGFDQERSILNELPSVVKAYQDDGFRTIFEQNASARTMNDMFREFETLSRDADRVIVHYIGNVSATIRNIYMNPTGSVPNSLVDRHQAGFGFDLVYDLLEHRPGRSAFLVGTPRGKSSFGIAARPQIPQGLLVLYGPALDVGRAARDTLLEKYASGREIDALARVNAAGFVSDFRLRPAAQNRPQVPAPNTPPDSAANAALVEMQVWREAANIGTRDALQRYLDRYPNGLFRGEAQSRLNALRPAKPIEQQIEEGLQMTRADRREIQLNLTTLGFDTRGVDGVFGRGTRAAIENWQRAEGFKATGFLDSTQIRVLNQKARAKAAADKQAQERADLNYWQSTGSGTTERGLRDYLAKFPSGLFAEQARQDLKQIENSKSKSTDANEAAFRREQALNMTQQTRALVEQRLSRLGYTVGPVDGTFTRETRRSIRAFQQKSGLTATGYMDNPTVTRLVASIFQ